MHQTADEVVIMVVVELFLLHVTDPKLGALLTEVIDQDPASVRRALAILHTDDAAGSPDGVYVARSIATVAPGEPLEVAFGRTRPVVTDAWMNDLGQPAVSFRRVPWLRASARAVVRSSDLVETHVEVFAGACHGDACTHVERTDALTIPGPLVLHEVTPAVWLLAESVPTEAPPDGQVVASALSEDFTAESARGGASGTRSTERAIRRLLR